MTITKGELEKVKEIILDGARTHFPPSVQFHDANVTIMLNADEEEYIDVELLYTAPSPVLDGHLMNTLFRVTDESMRAFGITAHTLVGYTDINDPTRWQYQPWPTVPPGHHAFPRTLRQGSESGIERRLMETTATFEKDYENLEREFAARVEEDNRDFEERVKRGDYRGIFLPNVRPTGKVDYVLVGMEPSLGGWARDVDHAYVKIARGFRNFSGVEILHFPIKNYLLRDGETYYLTDLAKGAMLTTSPDAGSTEKYEARYPLLEKELEIVAKPDAKVIAIGTKVDGFLKKKVEGNKLCGRVYAGWIPHYSSQAASHRGKWIDAGKQEYETFAASLQGSKWTNSERKLLFDYKILFKKIRNTKV